VLVLTLAANAPLVVSHKHFAPLRMIEPGQRGSVSFGWGFDQPQRHSVAEPNAGLGRVQDFETRRDLEISADRKPSLAPHRLQTLIGFRLSDSQAGFFEGDKLVDLLAYQGQDAPVQLAIAEVLDEGLGPC